MRSSSRSALWLATSVFSATLTRSRDPSKVPTSAISPTARRVMATNSSNSVKPSSAARQRRSDRGARRLAIEVPHVEAVVEDDAVRVAGLAVAAGRHLHCRAHIVGRGGREDGGPVQHAVDYH